MSNKISPATKIAAKFKSYAEFDENDIGFLKGLVAADVEGASQLLDAVYKYEYIRVETSE